MAQEDGQDKLEGRQLEAEVKQEDERRCQVGLRGQLEGTEGAWEREGPELSAEHEVHASNNIFFFCCDSVIE